MISIVLVEDHTLVRQGIRMILEAQPDFSVIGDAGDGVAGATLIERLQPQVAAVDLMLPGLSGLDLTQRVRRRAPKTKIVVLTMHSSTSFALAAFNRGASAYVHKRASGTELVHAVRQAVSGQTYVSPPLSMEAVQAHARRTQGGSLDSYESLTEREREVLHLAAEGLTCAAIGERLCISPRTVEAHRAHLMRKLALANQTDLTVYAVKRGLVVPEATHERGSSDGV